jgi:hypothetical protein
MTSGSKFDSAPIALSAFAGAPAQAATATMDSTTAYQTIDGWGGATAFYGLMNSFTPPDA